MQKLLNTLTVLLLAFSVIHASEPSQPEKQDTQKSQPENRATTTEDSGQRDLNNLLALVCTLPLVHAEESPATAQISPNLATSSEDPELIPLIVIEDGEATFIAKNASFPIRWLLDGHASGLMSKASFWAHVLLCKDIDSTKIPASHKENFNKLSTELQAFARTAYGEQTTAVSAYGVSSDKHKTVASSSDDATRIAAEVTESRARELFLKLIPASITDIIQVEAALRAGQLTDVPAFLMYTTKNFRKMVLRDGAQLLKIPGGSMLCTKQACFLVKSRSSKK